MSTNFIEVVTLDFVKPHPDADKLDIAIVRNCPTVVPKGRFVKGQKVVYFPPDMLIPERVANELGVAKYLKHSTYPGDIGASQCRIAACRLRGQPSFGFIVPFEEVFFGGDDHPAGTDVTARFNGVKYEPPQKCRAENAAPEHAAFHKYTSIENIHRYPNAIPEGAEVRITEKIHGTNGRWGLIQVDNEWRFMAGSHHVNRKKPESGKSVYWEPLENAGLLNMLTELCDEQFNVVVFGEIFGPGVQDMSYGVPVGERAFRVFDISINGKYLDYQRLKDTCDTFGVEMVPILYVGPFSHEVVQKFTDGPTTIGQHAGKFKGREGVVITTTVEDFYAPTGGRRIVKSVSADYLDRKGAVDQGELEAA